jgi:hypothetical protein
VISEELKKYLEMVSQEDQDNDLSEMSNLDSDDHGIENVVIWIGRSNKRHGLRVKVSNIPNSWSDTDNFTIMIPQLNYDPQAVARWIKRPTLERILLWIKINQPLLYKLEAGEYSSFKKFANDVSKV